MCFIRNNKIFCFIDNGTSTKVCTTMLKQLYGSSFYVGEYLILKIPNNLAFGDGKKKFENFVYWAHFRICFETDTLSFGKIGKIFMILLQKEILIIDSI